MVTCLFSADEANVSGNKTCVAYVLADIVLSDMLSKASDHDGVVGWNATITFVTEIGKMLVKFIGHSCTSATYL